MSVINYNFPGRGSFALDLSKSGWFEGTTLIYDLKEGSMLFNEACALMKFAEAVHNTEHFNQGFTLKAHLFGTGYGDEPSKLKQIYVECTAPSGYSCSRTFSFEDILIEADTGWVTEKLNALVEKARKRSNWDEE